MLAEWRRVYVGLRVLVVRLHSYSIGERTILLVAWPALVCLRRAVVWVWPRRDAFELVEEVPEGLRVLLELSGSRRANIFIVRTLSWHLRLDRAVEWLLHVRVLAVGHGGLVLLVR